VWWVRWKKVDGPREGEKTSWGKLGGMGMMGRWMEVRAHMGIRVKLRASFPLDAYWDN
jgi:hypothetical protein